MTPTHWTFDEVATRLQEAADTGRRLSPVRVQGYYNLWPSFIRREWEAFAAEERHYQHYPPTPDAIDRMLETMRWVQWLEIDQRHLVWMRAKGYAWEDIAIRCACCRTTAWRHWHKAIDRLLHHLNPTQHPVTQEQLQ